jgi:hypothetical protein
MRLVDPQPMETLPYGGIVFVEYTFDDSETRRYINRWHVDQVRYTPRPGTVFLAWSDAATTKPEGEV